MSVSGVGGFLVLFKNGDNNNTPPIARRVDVARWTLRRESQKAPVSNASVGQSRTAHVLAINTWTIELHLDDTNLPTAAGIRLGDVVYVYFRLGSTFFPLYHHLAQTTVVMVSEVDSSKGGEVISMTVMGEGGDLTEYVGSIPVGPYTSPPPAVPYIGGGLDPTGTFPGTL